MDIKGAFPIKINITFEKILLVSAALFFLLRFIRLFTYPAEFIGDELVDITESILKSRGWHPFFFQDSAGGAGGNMLNQIGMFFTPLFTYNIGYYRLVPVLIDALFLYGLYLLAKEYFDGLTAALAVFVASVSFWNFFNSRIFLANELMPMLAVFTLYSLAKFRQAKGLFIGAALLLFIAGFNTYFAWHLTALVILFTLFQAYQEPGADKQRIKISALLFFISYAAVLLITLNSAGAGWVAAMLDSNNNKGGILRNLLNLKLLCVGSGGDPDFYPSDAPLFNPLEFVLLVSGIVLLFLRPRAKYNTPLLFMLAVFLLPLIVTADTHQMRAVMLQVPAFIISAAALAFIYKKNRPAAYSLLAIMALLSAFSISHFFKTWETSLIRDFSGAQIAMELDKGFSGDAAYLGNFDRPQKEITMRTVIRLRNYYHPGTKPAFIAARFNAMWARELQSFIKNNFPGCAVESSVFKSNLKGEYRHFPALVLVVPSSCPLSVVLEQGDAMLKTIPGNGEFALKTINSMFSGAASSALLNTTLKEAKALALMDLGKYEDAAKAYLDNSFPSWTPPDFYLKAARCCAIAGNKAGAETLLRTFGEMVKENNPQ